MEQTRGLLCNVGLRCSLLSITIPVSLLANEFNVRSVLHGQVSLAAVNLIFWNSWGYERLQKSKDSLKDCFKNVNITAWMKVFRIIPEFRILRLTFHRKSASKC